MAGAKLQVVESASTFANDLSHGVIVVESTEKSAFNLAIDALSTAEARVLALGYAASRGVADPRINGSPSSAYPVNHEGLALEMVKDASGQTLPADHPRMQPACYRIDIPVTRRLV